MELVKDEGGDFVQPFRVGDAWIIMVRDEGALRYAKLDVGVERMPQLTPPK